MRVWLKHGWALLLLTVLFLGVATSVSYAENGQISGVVWLEKSVEGVFDAGETGFSGAKLTLEKKDGGGQPQAMVNTTSSANGEYVFPSVAPGEYRLRLEVSADYRFTVHGKDSVALPAQGSVSYSPYFTVSEGQRVTANVGLTKSYSAVTVIAFVDENQNGGRMETEGLARDVAIDLLYEYAGETYVVASGVTDRQGELLLQDLSPAEYKARATLPGTFVAGPLGQKMNTYYNCFTQETEDTALTAAFTLQAKDSLGLGIGLVRSSSMSGKIWYDANFNGLWDADESGLTSASVTLSAASMTPRTVHPDESGVYTFRGLQPGDYTVTFDLPEGMIFTYPGISLISDTASQASVHASVQVDITSNLGSVGVMPAAGFSMVFFMDDNLNGAYDEGEAPLNSAEISAAQGGKTIETAVSGQDGVARLSGLRAGDTEISVSLPDGCIFTARQDLLPVSGPQSEARTALTLDGTQADKPLYVGVTRPAAISGLLFEDELNTGLLTEGSRPLSGFTVQAVNAETGETALETRTDEMGAYSLSPLCPGAYTVRFLLDNVYVASPYAADTDASANRIKTQTQEYGETETIALRPDEALSGVNGGIFRAGVADGYVLIDPAITQETIGMKGVQVFLLNEKGMPLSSSARSATDENGYFYIKGILPGTYSVGYILPQNATLTDPATAASPYTTESFTTVSGSEIHLPTLYGTQNGTIAGMIMHENAGDGLFTATLTLIGQGSRQAVEKHANPDGSFEFTNLKPDVYTLSVTLPQNLVFGELAGSPFQPSANIRQSAEITLGLGQVRDDIYVMASLPVTVSGMVFYDDNLTGSQEEAEYGAEGRTLTLLKGGEVFASTETLEDGVFSFDRLVPETYELRIDLDDNEELVHVSQASKGEGAWSVPLAVAGDTQITLPVMRYASVSGAVWSLDGTTNGVSGIPVSLLTETGAIYSTVVTEEDGSYAFTTLMPGEYSLSATLPQGFLYARAQDAGSRDSYIQGQSDGTVVSIPFTVPMGDDLSGIDIGMGAMGAIGDRAWLDENGNGMQDIGEPDLPGIVIELYKQGQLLASATTDVYGRYLISDIYPGEYEMRVTMPPEVKTTVRQTDFPLVASVLPESDETTVTATVTVPSGKQSLHCDLGFQLRKEGVYPSVMETIPVKDWTPYSERQTAAPNP